MDNIKTSKPTRSVAREKSVVRLKFLADFMNQTNITTRDIADRIGMSRVGVFYWFDHDDVNISNLYEAFDRLGYVLKFELVPLHPVVRDDIADVSIKLRKTTPPEGRRYMDFLSRALTEYGISKAEVSKKMHLGSTTINYWLRQDDILISRLYAFAEAADLKLKVDIYPKSQNELIREELTSKEEVLDPVLKKVITTKDTVGVLIKQLLQEGENLKEYDGKAKLEARLNIKKLSIQIETLLKEYKKDSVQLSK